MNWTTLVINVLAAAAAYSVGFWIARRTPRRRVPPLTPREQAAMLSAREGCHTYVFADEGKVVEVHDADGCPTAFEAIVQHQVNEDLGAGLSLEAALEKRLGSHVVMVVPGDRTTPPDPHSVN